MNTSKSGVDDARLEVRLPRAHWVYLVETLNLPGSLLDRLRASLRRVDSEGGAELALTVDDADEIRERCAERLQTHGFDDEYKLTDEGRLLEELIDFLFTG